MATQYKTGIVITGDSTGGVKAIKLTSDQLYQLNRITEKSSQSARMAGKSFQDSGKEMESGAHRGRTAFSSFTNDAIRGIRNLVLAGGTIGLMMKAWDFAKMADHWKALQIQIES